MKKITIIISVIVIALLSWFLYFQEYFAYQKVLKAEDLSTCSSYYSDYPNGRYTKKVKLLEIEISRDFKLVRSFIDAYPNESNNTRLVSIKKELWEEVREQYEENIVGSYFNPKATNFFNKVLDYMEDQNEYVIVLNLDKKLNLKDYNEYPEEVRSYIDLVYMMGGGATPSTSKISSLTKNFSSGSTSLLENIVKDTLSAAFEEVFGTDFFEVKSNNDYQNDLGSPLVIDIDYRIKNQEIDNEGMVMPALWTYTVDEVFQGYVPAIMVDFDFDFNIPNTNSSYSFSKQVDPAEEVSGFGNIEEAYQMMTQTVFYNYTKLITSDFGLQ